MTNTPFIANDWIPECHEESGFQRWMELQGTWNEHEQREKTTQPVVVPWETFSARVVEQKAIRDSLRDQGFCFWPWQIAKYFKIDWLDFNQGNRGSCAGCATNNAVNAMLLMHLADGYHFKFQRFNPYFTWDLGKRDANYRSEGASLSMMLTCANKRGMFPVEKVGSYEDSLRNPPDYTQDLLNIAEKYQVAACYLGDFQGDELVRIVFDCVAAGYPIVFGNSIAVSQKTRYNGRIKNAVNSGGWMHATSRIAYRKESNGTEYIAHQGSWGEYWEVGKYEGEPASVVWESFDTFSQACHGRYADAFAICMVEADWANSSHMSLAPLKVPYP